MSIFEVYISWKWYNTIWIVALARKSCTDHSNHLLFASHDISMWSLFPVSLTLCICLSSNKEKKRESKFLLLHFWIILAIQFSFVVVVVVTRNCFKAKTREINKSWLLVSSVVSYILVDQVVYLKRIYTRL
jgi:hypothetical protein